jgi:hypothetical protein
LGNQEHGYCERCWRQRSVGLRERGLGPLREQARICRTCAMAPGAELRRSIEGPRLEGTRDRSPGATFTTWPAAKYGDRVEIRASVLGPTAYRVYDFAGEIVARLENEDDLPSDPNVGHLLRLPVQRPPSRRSRGRRPDRSHTGIARSWLVEEFDKRRNGLSVEAYKAVAGKRGRLTARERQIQDGLALIVYDMRRGRLASRKALARFLHCHPETITKLAQRGAALA